MRKLIVLMSLLLTSCVATALVAAAQDVWYCFQAALATGAWSQFIEDLKIILTALGGM